jgi:hypothetical protein
MEIFFNEPVLIVSRLTGLALTASKGEGTLVTMLNIDLMNPLQRFEFTKDNYIQVYGTENVLDVQGERKDAGAHIITYFKNGQLNQKWTYIATPGYIQCSMNSMVMDLCKEEVKETATLITWTHQRTLTQLWEIYLIEELDREKLELIIRKNKVVRTLGYNDYCLEIEIVNKSREDLTDPELWLEGGTADSIVGCDMGGRQRSRIYGSTSENLEGVLTFLCGKYRAAISITMVKKLLIFGGRMNAFNLVFIPLVKGADEELYQNMKESESTTSCVAKDSLHQMTGTISQGNKALLYIEIK